MKRDNQTSMCTEKDDGALAKQNRQEVRMINDVLVEPGNKVAPTKRRRGKAKRMIESKQQGKIQQYFVKLYATKDWSDTTENDGAPVDGGGGGAKKRKGDSGIFGSIQQTKSEKSRRLMMQESLVSRQETNFLGTISEVEGGMTKRLFWEEENGLELNSLTQMKGKCFLGIGPDDRENHINSQILN